MINWPITIQFINGTYKGVNVIPIVINAQTDVKKEKINDKDVSTATPFVPNLKPKKPEKKLLNKGKNIIKLIIDFLYNKFSRKILLK